MGHEPIPENVERIAREVVDAVLIVHRTLGPGLLESVYETCLAHECTKRGVAVDRQVSFPIVYDSVRFDAGFRLDLLIGGELIVELKSIEAILPVHKAQVITYLKLTGKRLALLINFNVPLIKQGVQRIVL